MFTAIFEIYNLVSIIQSDRPELGNIKDRIGLLSSELLKNFDETFTSNTDAGEDDTNPPRRARISGEHVYHDRRVVDAFTQAGYTLESDDEDEDG